MQAPAADIVALLLVVLAVGATVLARLPQREEIFGTSAIRAKGAIVGAGAAAVPASAIAHELAGPGVLPWLWLGCLLGLALLGRGEQSDGEESAAPARARPVLAAIALGLSGAFLMRNSAALGGGWVTPLALWGIAALTMVLAPPANSSPQWLRAPALLIAGVAVWMGLSGERPPGEFIGRVSEGATDFTVIAAGSAGGAAVAWLALVTQQGFLAAAHALAPAYTEADATPRHARGIAWAATLNAVLVSTLCIFAFDAHPGAAERLDEETFRARDGRAYMRPVERPHKRMFTPSPKGQTVVFPRDTTLQPDHAYKARFHANPRGYKIGIPAAEQNQVATVKLDSTASIDTIFFRDKDRQRAQSSAWDLRIPVNNEELAPGGGRSLIQLTPKDPSVDLIELAKTHDGPYLPVADVELELVARQALATAKGLGAHLAGIERESSGEQTDFTLQQLVPMGFRGPFFDLERAPAGLAFLARPDLGQENGELVPVEYRAPEGGVPLGLIGAGGELELPGWTQLESIEFVMFHHESGERSRSFMVPVQPADAPRVNGHLRFVSQPDAPTSLFKASKLEGYKGPFIPLPTQKRWVEVRSAKHLADAPSVAIADRGVVEHEMKHRQVLVPVGEGQAHRHDDESYSAPTSELIEAGFQGPFARTPEGTRAATLGGLGLLGAWLAWAFAAWVMLPGSPVLRLVATVMALAGLWLPFGVLYLAWIALAAGLLLLAWPRRARPGL